MNMENREIMYLFSERQFKQPKGIVYTFPGESSLFGGLFWGWSLNSGHSLGKGPAMEFSTQCFKMDDSGLE